VPNNASHKKRLRQSLVRRQRNRQVRSEIRTRTKSLLSMDSADEAKSALSELYTVLDRAARKNVIPPNAAARQKARAARHVNRLAGA
jgi:small subunit ribosomal protein S20